MKTITLLHNPRCSKSRQTLALLQEKGISPTIIEYLKQPLDGQQIAQIAKQLGVNSYRDMMRTKEPEYKQLGLHNAQTSENDLLDAMVSVPKLIERPVVIVGEQARIGRPPEAVLELITC
ncbi:arsenate reductase (glutaredoxin) [Alteromonas sp. C1M14]|uniref:arsenate reductase (glutaredoxin) n=1 Tax=Alteromonas sp. C1M14 TaxID=2841567 RepID=UPI001C0A2231|nr:arsenate reductase (glutaredoxin) [Alteromonas sp. C1M14]MBU2976789.1 arsenate reductase (glutaredoxin) [Alteromonas sp. C1M14]